MTQDDDIRYLKAALQDIKDGLVIQEELIAAEIARIENKVDREFENLNSAVENLIGEFQALNKKIGGNDANTE